jgi:Ni/Fe-hydrogenase subunit HybB-like protein
MSAALPPQAVPATGTAGRPQDPGSAHRAATPRGLATVPFFTPGTLVLLGLAAIGALFGAWRLLFGLGSVTNLDQDHPWGIWIALDVASGVALAAGGFTTSALAHVFHRERYHAVVRPALLTAMLGYTFVVIGLLFDLGRYYNVWHPMVMWQGNSVLFEVGMCVMAYITVLYLEFLPIVVERFRDGVRLPGPLRRLERPAEALLRLSGRVLDRVLFVFILLGVVLSCLHQSSLGTLMLIAPTKMHPLWFTPVMPLMFLLSAVMVGYPMVVLESLLAARSFRLEPEMAVLAPLARLIPLFLGLYLALKAVDLVLRGAHVYLLDGSAPAYCFLAEMVLGVAVPMVALLFRRVRRSPALLLASAGLVVAGVVLNRLNVFLVAYRPLYSEAPYVPAIGEIAITVGLTSALVLVYRFVVMNFPVIAGQPRSPARPSGPAVSTETAQP